MRRGKVSFQVFFRLPTFKDRHIFVFIFLPDVQTAFVAVAAIFGKDGGGIIQQDLEELFHTAGFDFHPGDNVDHIFILRNF